MSKKKVMSKNKNTSDELASHRLITDKKNHKPFFMSVVEFGQMLAARKEFSKADIKSAIRAAIDKRASELGCSPDAINQRFSTDTLNNSTTWEHLAECGIRPDHLVSFGDPLFHSMPQAGQVSFILGEWHADIWGDETQQTGNAKDDTRVVVEEDMTALSTVVNLIHVARRFNIAWNLSFAKSPKIFKDLDTWKAAVADE